jgi:hypothetical protein
MYDGIISKQLWQVDVWVNVLETSVDNDTNDRWDESTVETGNTIRGKGLLVDVNETVELTGPSTLGGLGVVGKTSTGVVKRVDEE